MMHVTLARFFVGDEKRSAIEILEYLFSDFSEKPYTKNDDQNGSKDSCHTFCHLASTALKSYFIKLLSPQKFVRTVLLRSASAPLKGSSGAAGEWWFSVTHPCILCSFGVPAPLKGSHPASMFTPALPAFLPILRRAAPWRQPTGAPSHRSHGLPA